MTEEELLQKMHKYTNQVWQFEKTQIQAYFRAKDKDAFWKQYLDELEKLYETMPQYKRKELLEFTRMIEKKEMAKGG